MRGNLDFLADARACKVWRNRELAALAALAIALSGAACGDDDNANGGDAGKTADSGMPPKHTATWTAMGFDSRNDYNQTAETRLNVSNAGQLAERWRFQIHGFPPGSPVVAEGKVFVMATGGTYAIDLDSGAMVWSADTLMGTASLAYADGVIYAHSADGFLTALNASDGSVVWGPVASNPSQTKCDGTSSPIVAGGKVLVGHSCGVPEVTGGDAQANARGGVEAFSTQDGSHLWTYWTVPESGENGASVWSTVAVDVEARVVFASTGNNYTMSGPNSDAIHAIDLETGELKWKQQVRTGDTWSLGSSDTSFVPTGEDTDFGANPILADVNGKKIVAAGDKGSAFWALDRETGEILWSVPMLSATHAANTGGVLNNGAFDGKYFYVASNEPPAAAQLHVLDPQDGHDVIPAEKLDATVWGALSLANGLLFVPVNNVLQVRNAKSGELITSFDTGGTIAAGAAAIADGNVIVKSGLSYAFASDAMNNDEIICYGLDKPAPTVDAGMMAPTGEPTFTGVYNDVIVAGGCAGSAICHSGDVGHLILKDKDSSYKALVNVPAMGTNLVPGSGPNCVDSGLVRVVPNKPDDSLLVKKLEATQPCGEAMPIGSMLSAAQIAQVRAWIDNGAKND
jgi:polyvinyl alcohol dehydrogenase (cytochrome)